MPALNRRSFTWILTAIFSLLHGGALAQPCLEWANTENAPPVREQGAIAYDSARELSYCSAACESTTTQLFPRREETTSTTLGNGTDQPGSCWSRHRALLRASGIK